MQGYYKIRRYDILSQAPIFLHAWMSVKIAFSTGLSVITLDADTDNSLCW